MEPATLNYRAKAWKTGNGVVITVPKELQGQILEVTLKATRNQQPDTRGVVKELSQELLSETKKGEAISIAAEESGPGRIRTPSLITIDSGEESPNTQDTAERLYITTQKTKADCRHTDKILARRQWRGTIEECVICAQCGDIFTPLVAP